MIEYDEIKHKITLNILGIKLSLTFSLGKILVKFFKPLIWFLDLIIPKNDKKIVFSFPDYGCNAEAYYSYMIKNYEKEYKCIKLLNYTDEKITEKNTYIYYSIVGIYHLLTSKYIVIMHTCNVVSLANNSRHIILNLWHGMPIKTIGCNEPNLNKILLDRYKTLGKYGYMFVTSDLFKQLMLSSFNGDYFKTYITGQPRTDLIWDNKNSEKIERLFNFKNYNKIIFYMPTYKQNPMEEQTQITTEYNNIFYMDDYDGKGFIDYIESNNILFIMKPHPFSEEFYEEHPDKLPKSSNFKYVDSDFFNNNGINAYEVFKYVDLMISDFSSVVLDYLILNRPVLFLSSLAKDYSANRGMILSDNYDILMPGAKVNDFQSMLTEIKNNLEDDSYKEQREKGLPLLHKYRDDKACERVFEIMRGL